MFYHFDGKTYPQRCITEVAITQAINSLCLVQLGTDTKTQDQYRQTIDFMNERWRGGGERARSTLYIN